VVLGPVFEVLPKFRDVSGCWPPFI